MRQAIGIAAASGLALAAACAQPPDKELELAESRVEQARAVEAQLYAFDTFSRAESALAEARTGLQRRASYPEAIARMTEAVSAADEAHREAVMHKLVVARHVSRSLKEIEGLLAIARSRGAAEKAPADLEGYEARYREVRTIAESGDLLGALDQGSRLEPELLAFEQSFR